MSAKKGFGAKLSYETTPGGGTFTDVASITKIKPFDLKADVIDSTAHDTAVDSNGNAWRTKLAGLLDAGSVMFDLNYDDKAPSHIFLKSYFGVERLWKITFPGSTPTTSTFNGFTKALPADIPHDNKMTSSAALEISGPVTIA